MEKPNLVKIHRRLKTALADRGIKKAATADLSWVLRSVGIDVTWAESSAGLMIGQLESAISLQLAENCIKQRLQDLQVLGAIKEKFARVADAFYSEVTPYVNEAEVIDYGCGDGRLGLFLLQRGMVKKFIGYDVFEYSHRVTGVPFRTFDERQVPEKEATFDVGLAVNVLRSSEESDRILADLRRVVKPGGKILVVEVAPQDETYYSRELLFIKDYIAGRLLYGEDMPVSGRSHTADEWSDSFMESNLSVQTVTSIHFSNEPLMAQDHKLFVLERE